MAGSSAPLSAPLLGDEQLGYEDDLDVLSYAPSPSKPLETADSSILATLSVQGAPNPPSRDATKVNSGLEPLSLTSAARRRNSQA